jgi:hypothetical protein
VLQQMAVDPVLDAGPEIASAVSAVIAGSFSRLARAGPASGPLYQNMLDAHDYGVDHATIGNSAEFHFDAGSSAYLDFIEDVRSLALEHFPVFGYIGIRFTPASSALIAMQQFALTASVEVSTPRTRLHDVYTGFLNAVHGAARARGGIPHWGQEMQDTSVELAAVYGDRLLRWRNALADISAGASQVFSTAFSRDKGLEPGGGSLAATQDDDAIDLFLSGLKAGID